MASCPVAGLDCGIGPRVPLLATVCTTHLRLGNSAVALRRPLSSIGWWRSPSPSSEHRVELVLSLGREIVALERSAMVFIPGMFFRRLIEVECSSRLVSAPHDEGHLGPHGAAEDSPGLILCGLEDEILPELHWQTLQEVLLQLVVWNLSSSSGSIFFDEIVILSDRAGDCGISFHRCRPLQAVSDFDNQASSATVDFPAQGSPDLGSMSLGLDSSVDLCCLTTLGAHLQESPQMAGDDAQVLAVEVEDALGAIDR